MARSNNSRRGKRHGRGHEKRHNHCGDKHCDYCERNFTIAATRQKQRGTDPKETDG